MDARTFLEERHGVTFMRCAYESLGTPIVEEWERLTGEKLLANTPLDRMIDVATGYDVETMHEYLEFVYEYIFLRF